MVTIALAKGRLADESIILLEKAGVDCSAIDESSRKLVFYDKQKLFSFILVKPGDVATYIERGAADIGIVGKDTLLEEKYDVYEMLDLKLGACRICVAGFENKKPRVGNIVVASKFVNVARKYYDSKGINADIIKLNGSVELAPIMGMSDVIVDLVESGKTLKENGLSVLEVICEVSARLVVNKVSLKTKSQQITKLLHNLRQFTEENNADN